MRGGMAHIRKRYGVPAKRGMRVKVYSEKPGRWMLAHDGRITISDGQYIWISSVGPFHPTYGVVYFGNDGEVLKDCRPRERR